MYLPKSKYQSNLTAAPGALKIKADTSFMVLAIIMIALAIVYSNYSVTKHIGAMREATLSKMGSGQSHDALLGALIEECQYNAEQITLTIQGKGKAPFNVSFDAYKANLYNATIDDADLLKHLVRVYADTKGIRHVLLYIAKTDSTSAGVPPAVLNELLTGYRSLEKDIGEYRTK